MPNSSCRLVVLPCALLTLIVIGAPDFTAVERAMSKAFVTHTDWRAGADSAALATSVQDTSETPPVLSVTAFVWAFDGVAAAGSTQPENAVAPRRPAARRLLVPLYVSFATLQALDMHSTFYAIHRGASEVNPLMATLVEHPVAFAALKAGMATGIIYMTERVRRHSRVGAIVMMAAFNSAYAIVVAKNYRLGSRLEP